MIITDLLSYIGQTALYLISTFGYFGIFILMALESMIAPVPSEIVMPFAGFLISKGNFSFIGVILASSFGSIAGSLISYYLGYYGGNRLVKKFGKYLFLDSEDLKKTENWFKSRGEKTVLISRFIPVVRHLISIPAGIGKININKFVIYTLLGATAWNFILTYLGYMAGENWEIIKHYSEFISIPVAIILLIAGSFVVYRHIKHKIEKKA